MGTGAYVAPVTVPLGAFLGCAIGYNIGSKIKFIFADNDHVDKKSNN
jgi:hypothetical protein